MIEVQQTVEVEITNEYVRAFVLDSLWSTLRAEAPDGQDDTPTLTAWVIGGDTGELYWAQMQRVRKLEEMIKHASEPQTTHVVLPISRDEFITGVRENVEWLWDPTDNLLARESTPGQQRDLLAAAKAGAAIVADLTQFATTSDDQDGGETA
jgi:hypothetical protein